MRNSLYAHRQRWITVYRFATVALLMALVVIGIVLLNRSTASVPTASEIAKAVNAPTASEIAKAVNGPAMFERPSSMEYVVKTDSCVVGGTVTSSAWHVGSKTVPVGKGDSNAVDYTDFGFQADNGQVFTVYDKDALFVDPGENLGLELNCDPQTIETADTFGMIAIIWGGK